MSLFLKDKSNSVLRTKMCNECNKGGCNRDVYENPRPTPIKQLRKHEKLLHLSKPKNEIEFYGLLKPKEFEFIGDPRGNLIQKLSYIFGVYQHGNWTNTGASNCSSFQIVKGRGKGRYHKRVYLYPSHIVVESHIDAINPKNDLYGHWKEHCEHQVGSRKESKHNVIVYRI